MRAWYRDLGKWSRRTAGGGQSGCSPGHILRQHRPRCDMLLAGRDLLYEGAERTSMTATIVAYTLRALHLRGNGRYKKSKISMPVQTPRTNLTHYILMRSDQRRRCLELLRNCLFGHFADCSPKAEHGINYDLDSFVTAKAIVESLISYSSGQALTLFGGLLGLVR